jgi:Subtilase family
MSPAHRYGSTSCRSSVSRIRLLIEELEVRTVPSAGPAAVATPALTFPFPTGGFTPYQIRHAYGFDAINFTKRTTVVPGNGAGQTIAVIDPFDDPQIANDLAAFDSAFGIPAPPSFQEVGQTGGPVPTQTNEGWAVETSLDVEWAHALAPGANILLVEANSDFLTDLFAGAQFAATQAGVSVVNMSFGSGEFQTEASYDSMFTTPHGHQGVTFVASTGDTGAPGEYPAYSPNVLAVGGTSLTLDAAGNYASETGWGSGAGQPGSGGGQSLVEREPAFQMSVQHSGMRQIPDVAFDADPNTGVPICDTLGFSGQTGWFQTGGTSFAAPAWSALMAIGNQGRVLAGKGTLLDRQAAKALYGLPAGDFHDIVAGNNGYPAGPGYDMVTGRGSPLAAKVVAGLVSGPHAARRLPADHLNEISKLMSHDRFDVVDTAYATTPGFGVQLTTLSASQTAASASTALAAVPPAAVQIPNPVAPLIVQNSLPSYADRSGALGNSTQVEPNSSTLAPKEGTNDSALSVDAWIDWSAEGFVG